MRNLNNFQNRDLKNYKLRQIVVSPNISIYSVKTNALNVFVSQI